MILQSKNDPPLCLKILVLGLTGCGKSAVTVRYLTKRYISEYSSSRDFLYQHSLSLDDSKTEVAIMDSCGIKEGPCLYNQISWADAFVVVYAINDHKSFTHARDLLDTICVLKDLKRPPILLLGNKRDLEHARQVTAEEGQQISLQYQCQFHEVSVAESSVGVTLSIQNLIKEAKFLFHYLPNALAIRSQTMPVAKNSSSTSIFRSSSFRMRGGPSAAVSKVIGLVFGNRTSGYGSQRSAPLGKKRPSLSI